MFLQAHEATTAAQGDTAAISLEIDAAGLPENVDLLPRCQRRRRFGRGGSGCGWRWRGGGGRSRGRWLGCRRRRSRGSADGGKRLLTRRRYPSGVLLQALEG